jgi:hypothetical protein
MKQDSTKRNNGESRITSFHANFLVSNKAENFIRIQKRIIYWKLVQKFIKFSQNLIL